MTAITEIREMMGNANDQEPGLSEGAMQAAAEWISQRTTPESIRDMTGTEWNAIQEQAIEAVTIKIGEG